MEILVVLNMARAKMAKAQAKIANAMVVAKVTTTRKERTKEKER